MVQVAPSDAQRIYADGNGPVSGKDLFRSEDGGVTWTDISGGVVGGYGQEVAIDATDPDHLYALAGLVYESHDGGDSWTLASNGIPTGRYLSGLAMDRFDPTLLYTFVNSDLYRTNDGANWVPVDMTGCTGFTSGQGLATDPAHSGVVYVTTYQGACRGTGGGRAWATLPDIAPYYLGQMIAVAPDGGAVYVATRGGGVVRYPAP
jgi:photosystem II stability/assembly factor-like uncharacterized protein